MKRLIVAGAILAAAGSASADNWFGDCSPVIGIDYKQSRVKNSGDWPHVFPQSFPGVSVYVGTKFMENFGAELGYDTTAKRSRDSTFVAGDRVGGAVVPGADGLNSKVRFSGPHLDLIGFWPLENCWEAFVSVGLGWVKPTVQVTDVGGPANTNFDRDITSISGSGKTIARVGVGVNWMATDVIGLRLKALWEDTSRLKVKSNAASGNQVLTNFSPWKDTFSIAVGAFLKF